MKHRAALLGEPESDRAADRRVALILNPASRNHQKALRLFIAAVEAAGWATPAVLVTTIAQPGRAQVREALANGADLIVVAGGDGTVREVAGGLAHSGVPLGIIPLGTANLFARNLGLPRHLTRVVDVALHGSVIDIDLGQADLTPDQQPEAHQRQTFLVVAGIGHDASTVARTSRQLKRIVGWLAYLVSGAGHLFRTAIPMDVMVDSGPSERVHAWSVLAGNASRIPLGIQVFPGAVMDDGEFRTLYVTLRHPWQWLSIALKGIFAPDRDIDWLKYGRAASLTVTPAKPVRVELDGDPFPEVTQVRLTVDHRALRVKVPSPPSGRCTR